jgi:cell division protein FtsB
LGGNVPQIDPKCPERAVTVTSLSISRLRPYLPTALIAIVIAWACVQYLTGDKGFFSQEARNKEIAYKEAQLSRLEMERKDLVARAHYLKSDNLSRDLLEERAHIVLGFSAPDEYVIRPNTASDQQG